MKLTGNRCQCPTCSDYFNGTQPFAKHRVGQYPKSGEHHEARRCLTVQEMKEAGFIRNAAGFWCTRATKPNAQRDAQGFLAHRRHGAIIRPTPTRAAGKTRARREGAT